MTGLRTVLSCSTEGWGCVGPTHSFHSDPQEGNPKDTMACLCPLNSATGPRKRGSGCSMPGLANPSPPDPRTTHEDICGRARTCYVLGRDPTHLTCPPPGRGSPTETLARTYPEGVQAAGEVAPRCDLPFAEPF